MRRFQRHLVALEDDRVSGGGWWDLFTTEQQTGSAPRLLLHGAHDARRLSLSPQNPTQGPGCHPQLAARGHAAPLPSPPVTKAANSPASPLKCFFPPQPPSSQGGLRFPSARTWWMDVTVRTPG